MLNKHNNKANLSDWTEDHYWGFPSFSKERTTIDLTRINDTHSRWTIHIGEFTAGSSSEDVFEALGGAVDDLRAEIKASQEDLVELERQYDEMGRK